MIQSLGQKVRGSNVILKLHMAKAFDMIFWRFIGEVLAAFDVNTNFFDLISRCIEGPWFSLIINGGMERFFKSSRGVRQGDPLSPTLFIIAIEFLIRRINKIFREDQRMYFHMGISVPVTCLAFADDFILFTNGSKSSLQKIKKTSQGKWLILLRVVLLHAIFSLLISNVSLAIPLGFDMNIF
ncbi:hypothetical protein LIER_17188 [Lithospermum erythrorhizon]|uniref:Reverse transcriptase domain-containing protein n=1 Tax=Lithospermum erythrorhizon TaxID=34254 RepID=A0AAV3QBY4_LITER